VTKVPLLGDIPILGYAFKQTGKGIDKTELLIFLTPRIIKESVTAVR
jgi:type IV pilus assembly protein PilQ